MVERGSTTGAIGWTGKNHKGVAMGSENPKLNENSDRQKKTLTDFVASWMEKLAAAYRQEVTTETQAMYLEGLKDLPMSRLNEAFNRAFRECKFFPSIAEIRAFETQVQVPQELLDAAYERFTQRILAQPEVKMLESVHDEPKPKRHEIAPMSEEEATRRLNVLLKQAEEMKSR